MGVDGCPDKWLAVEYNDEEFVAVERYEDVESLWNYHDDAASTLIDVPIGLREEDSTPRPCDFSICQLPQIVVTKSGQIITNPGLVEILKR